MTATAIAFPNEPRFRPNVRELVCDVCRYGIVVRNEPPECPMCRPHSWSERVHWSRWN